MLFPKLIASSYRGTVYRNIFTCSPSQNLLEDVCDQAEAEIVDRLIQITSEIDHQAPQVHRVFQYGVIDSDEVLSVFQKEKWNVGRFGDGEDYGVWYAAEEELTSVYEACWTAYRLARDNVLSRGEVYTTDRVMFTAHVSTDQAVDLTKENDFFNQLTVSEDYRFCQKLGRKIHESKMELIRTCSARQLSGICIPVFSPKSIQSISFSYNLVLSIFPDGMIHVSSIREGIGRIFNFDKDGRVR